MGALTCTVGDRSSRQLPIMALRLEDGRVHLTFKVARDMADSYSFLFSVDDLIKLREFFYTATNEVAAQASKRGAVFSTPRSSQPTSPPPCPACGGAGGFNRFIQMQGEGTSTYTAHEYVQCSLCSGAGEM